MASAHSSAELPPGHVVSGKYRIEKVIGKGAMGVVYQAEHLVLNERVALKFIQRFEDAGRQERFLREARTGARLRSDHSVRVLDVGELPQGQHFLVMELLLGRNLRDVLSTQGPLPIEEAVDVIIQACDALAEAHQRGIVHRDLKPANLFLTQRNDGSSLVKVLDFGVAKHTGLDADDLTSSNDIVGSPAYMSPEQLRSSRQASPTSDIWSLGVVLYELLAGRRPFTGETTPDLILSICTEPPRPLARAHDDLPADLWSVLVDCFQKNPQLRPPTVASLAERLLPFTSSAYSKLIGARLARLDFSAQSQSGSWPSLTSEVRQLGQETSTSTGTTTSSQDGRDLVAITSQHALPAIPAPQAALTAPPADPRPAGTRSPLRRVGPIVVVAAALPLAWLALGASRTPSPSSLSPSAPPQPLASLSASPDASANLAPSIASSGLPAPLPVTSAAAAASIPAPPPALTTRPAASSAGRQNSSSPPLRTSSQPTPPRPPGDDLFVPSSRR